MTNHRFFVALSVLLVLSSLCTLCGGRSGSVTQWNSVTEDASEILLIDIHISEKQAVEFLIASDTPFVWIWSVNGEERDESEGESSNFGYMFDEYGSYNVCARGSRENEITAYACMKIFY